MVIECSKSLDTEIIQLSTLTVPTHITNSNIHSVPSCSVGQDLLHKLCCGGALGLLNCQNSITVVAGGIDWGKSFWEGGQVGIYAFVGLCCMCC